MFSVMYVKFRWAYSGPKGGREAVFPLPASVLAVAAASAAFLSSSSIKLSKFAFAARELTVESTDLKNDIGERAAQKFTGN